jgi:hypothetical protein
LDNEGHEKLNENLDFFNQVGDIITVSVKNTNGNFGVSGLNNNVLNG